MIYTQLSACRIYIVCEAFVKSNVLKGVRIVVFSVCKITVFLISIGSKNQLQTTTCKDLFREQLVAELASKCIVF